MRSVINLGLMLIGLTASVLPLALDQLNLAQFDTYTMGASALVGVAAVFTAVDPTARPSRR